MTGRFLLFTTFLLASCGSQEAAEPTPGSANTAEAVIPASPNEKVVEKPVSEAVVIEEKSDLVEFHLSWPAEAAAITSIDSAMRSDARDMLAKLKADAASERTARAETGAPFGPFAYEAKWTVAADTAELLSLNAKIYEYAGGAHGNTAFAAILWDRQLNKRLLAPDLFTNHVQGLATITDAYCSELDKERAKRRGETLPLQGDDWQVQCPDVEEQPLSLIDGNRDGRIEVIRVLIAPYTAGPYAEGTYEVDVAVTDRLRAMIKPEYRASF